MIVLPDQRHRQVAQHGIGPQSILCRGGVRGGKTVFKALHCLNAGSLLCTDGQADKDMFGHNRVSFPLFVYHTANCAAVQGAALLFSAVPYKRTMPDSPKAARHHIFSVQRADSVHRALVLLCHLCKLLLCTLQLSCTQGLGQGIGGRV